MPSLDDIQQSINRLIQLTLDVSRGVAHWGQQHLQKSSTVLEGSSPSSPSQIGIKTAKKDESEFYAPGGEGWAKGLGEFIMGEGKQLGIIRRGQKKDGGRKQQGGGV